MHTCTLYARYMLTCTSTKYLLHISNKEISATYISYIHQLHISNEEEAASLQERTPLYRDLMGVIVGYLYTCTNTPVPTYLSPQHAT